MENCMNYIIKICFVFNALLLAGNINSFDDMQDALQHMHQLFEEDSTLLELYNAGNAPALNDHVLSDNEIGQFKLSLEPWDAPLFEDLLEQNIPADLSALTPSTSSEHEAYSESTALALQTAAFSVLKVQKKSRKKIFTCDHPGCDYTTFKNSNLTRHKFIHTGEKPYKCDHPKCIYATGDKSILARHKQYHAKEKLYKCDHPECPFATGNNSNLTKHKKNKHPRALDQESSENKRQRRQ